MMNVAERENGSIGDHLKAASLSDLFCETLSTKSKHRNRAELKDPLGFALAQIAACLVCQPANWMSRVLEQEQVGRQLGFVSLDY